MICLQIQPRSRKRRVISETETAQGPESSHPFQSTPTDIENSHIGQRHDTKTDSLPDPLFDEADTLVWDPENDLGEEEEEVVVIQWDYVEEDEDVTQVTFYLEFLYKNIFLDLSFQMFRGVSCTICIKNKYSLLLLMKVEVS